MGKDRREDFSGAELALINSHGSLRRGSPDGGPGYWALQRQILRSEGPQSVLAVALGRDIKGQLSPCSARWLRLTPSISLKPWGW